MPKHAGLEKSREKKRARNTESQYQNTAWDTDECSSPSHRRTHEGRRCSCTGSKDRDHSWVWTRRLCAHRSEQATPLKDTSTYSHTLKKLSTHSHEGQSLQQPHSLAHTNMAPNAKLNLALTHTPFMLYLESQFSWINENYWHLLPVIMAELCWFPTHKNTHCCFWGGAVENTVSRMKAWSRFSVTLGSSSIWLASR